MSRTIKSRRRILMAALVVLGLLSYAVLLRDVPGPPPSEENDLADAIVVLGGMAPERVEMTVHLYAQGVAPVVVVSGDHGEIVAALKGRLPVAAIRHENAATSTYENARFTEPILRQMGAREVVIVTSWYHARRALCIFQHCMPDIHFRVAYLPKPAILSEKDRQMARRERLAIWHTTLMHGIWCL